MIELSFFGEDAKFHHLGVAVRSIREASPLSEPIIDRIQEVAVAFVYLNGIQFELIEPYGKRSPITQSLEKGLKLLHVCYAVPDLKVAIKMCRRYGFHSIRQSVPAVAFNNRKIAWVYSNQYGLFELLEDPGTMINGSGESR
jgi:methylmalonyl-CoA/ethylmalonyl-CoA epimerase